MYNFKNEKEKERVFEYWNHKRSAEPICEIIEQNFGDREFTFCEIGCQLAGLSDLILNEFDKSRVYAIDVLNCNPKTVNFLSENFLGRFSFILETSLESYNFFEDNFFDMIYIDTSPHKYNQLKKEIDLWIPKVKDGGVVAFHDYEHANHPDVKKCIDEYCDVNNLELNVKDYYNVFFIK